MTLYCNRCGAEKQVTTKEKQVKSLNPCKCGNGSFTHKLIPGHPRKVA